MSNDLISRKTLLEEMVSLRIELNGISCRKEFKKTVKEVLTCVKHIIYDQPTAFDKEKVIDDLKTNMGSVQGISGQAVTFMFSDGYYNGAKDAIEIVKKGGVE